MSKTEKAGVESEKTVERIRAPKTAELRPAQGKPAPRGASISRETKETRIAAVLRLEPGLIRVDTGIGFLDHLLSTLAFHGGFSLELVCRGDLAVDDHHSAEDCGIVLGDLVREALGNRSGIRRFADACAPLDEALARAVVDISGRPFARTDLRLARDSIGGLSCENIPHFVQSFAVHAGITVHLDILAGDNDHHKAEAAFKSLALALKSAWSPAQPIPGVDPSENSGARSIPSAKGVLG